MRTDPNPDWLLRGVARRAASAPTPTASDLISSTVRGDQPLPQEVTETDLAAHAAAVELREARARIRHLEQGLRTAGKVLAPYMGGNGR
jgi:hypothetical protein